MKPASAFARCEAYPLGASLTLAELEGDLEKIYGRLLEEEPVSWIEALGMWWVVRDEDVRTLLADPRLQTTSPRSTILETFGDQMLSSEGPQHRLYRRVAQPAFQPAAVRAALTGRITALAERLVDDFSGGQVELRGAFAARLPVQTMLAVFGLPEADEQLLREWYDAFEGGLANFTGDDGLRRRAGHAMAEFHTHLQGAIERTKEAGGESLLARLISRSGEGRPLGDPEIRRNAAIIMFGGISTVEALILNAVWSLNRNPDARQVALRDPARWSSVIEETIRWQSPVQSATRHASCDIRFHGHLFAAGDVVNCMLGAANRDPRAWPDPGRFDIGRARAQRHLGFATGPHFCLGMHLARLQGRIALEVLHRRLPGLALVGDAGPQSPGGFEFRQPRSLWLEWKTAQ